MFSVLKDAGLTTNFSQCNLVVTLINAGNIEPDELIRRADEFMKPSYQRGDGATPAFTAVDSYSSPRVIIVATQRILYNLIKNIGKVCQCKVKVWVDARYGPRDTSNWQSFCLWFVAFR